MDYKEKYEKAIERAQVWWEKQGMITNMQSIIRDIFPEIKEYNDEKIRMWIQEELHLLYQKASGDKDRENDLIKAIAWLEKQGSQILDNSAKTCKDEQQPTNKVEPKFKKGDWVARNNEVLQISAIDKMLDGTFHYWFTKGTWLSSEKMNDAHLWTIQDANPGDIISFNDGHGNDCIELIKSITDTKKDKKIEFWFCLTNNNYCEVFDGCIPYTNMTSRQGAIPATKEQRELLFQKMHEAGYEWDAEKKELKKIEQNPAWSDEDEQTFIKSVEALEDFGKFELADWLKEHKNHFLRSQNRWKPSKKQLEAIANATALTEEQGEALYSLYNDLKKHKEE